MAFLQHACIIEDQHIEATSQHREQFGACVMTVRPDIGARLDGDEESLHEVIRAVVHVQMRATTRRLCRLASEIFELNDGYLLHILTRRILASAARGDVMALRTTR